MTHKARLHPTWLGGRTGYVYSVIYGGELLVDRSRDPEFDAARALMARGIITGKLTLCDGKTGVPRSVIDIEQAAKLATSEGQHRLRFVKWTPMPTDLKAQQSGDGEPSSPESDAA